MMRVSWSTAPAPPSPPVPRLPPQHLLEVLPRPFPSRQAEVAPAVVPRLHAAGLERRRPRQVRLRLVVSAEPHEHDARQMAHVLVVRGNERAASRHGSAPALSPASSLRRPRL